MLMMTLMAIKSKSRLGKSSSMRGVTLTELAVSVTIISLMIAGTLSGTVIIKGAKIRKAVSELTTYMTAINEFQTQYGYLPGDLPNAVSYWGTYAAGPPITGAHNGNGDGYVDNISSVEDLYTWEHLNRAKLVGESYTGAIIDGSTRYRAGVNAPASEPFTVGVYSFQVAHDLTYLTRGHVLRLGEIIVGGVPYGGGLLAKDAYSIDAKIDDGLASSGMLYTTRYGAGCTDGEYTATVPVNYVLSDVTNASCRLFYWQKKF